MAHMLLTPVVLPGALQDRPRLVKRLGGGDWRIAIGNSVYEVSEGDKDVGNGFSLRVARVDLPNDSE